MILGWFWLAVKIWDDYLVGDDDSFPRFIWLSYDAKAED
jgi:hypothetical protein